MMEPYSDINKMFDEIGEARWYERAIYTIRERAKSAIYGIKYAWQRLVRGYDDRAWWNMDTYLADIIAKLSKELREKGVGVPVIVYNELGFKPNSNGEYNEIEQYHAKEKWDNILFDIEEGFKEYSGVGDCMLYPDEKLKKFDNAFTLLGKYYSNLWD